MIKGIEVESDSLKIKIEPDFEIEITKDSIKIGSFKIYNFDYKAKTIIESSLASYDIIEDELENFDMLIETVHKEYPLFDKEQWIVEWLQDQLLKLTSHAQYIYFLYCVCFRCTNMIDVFRKNIKSYIYGFCVELVSYYLIEDCDYNLLIKSLPCFFDFSYDECSSIHFKSIVDSICGPVKKEFGKNIIKNIPNCRCNVEIINLKKIIKLSEKPVRVLSRTDMRIPDCYRKHFVYFHPWFYENFLDKIHSTKYSILGSYMFIYVNLNNYYYFNVSSDDEYE